ncbi:MAG TPA: hypothetical protein VFE20_06910 [Thermoleophilia bacterium]|nr:hypothetical protein [Thermoleophilia bacterium]
MSTTLSRSFVVAVLAALVVVLVAVPAYALPGKPDFSPHIYADGSAWGTKVVTVLDEPNGQALAHSFDKLYAITNGVDGQLPVAEAAPGQGYNGGRWYTQTVTWNDGVTPVLLKSEAQLLIYAYEGKLSVTSGSPGGLGAPPDFFICPLLPLK